MNEAKKSNSLFLETIKTLLMLAKRKQKRNETKNLLARNYFYQKERWENILRYVNDGEVERHYR